MDTIDDVEIETRNAALEESVGDIVEFAKQSKSSFPFVFIDPTGWRSLALDVIQPLLLLNPGEVLINFMTGHIRRFIDSQHLETQESFTRLFGSTEFRSRLKGLEKCDREDAAVREYMRTVKRAGSYGFASPALVLHPEINRSHFHLIYLTRSTKGIEVFKDAERQAMKKMEIARAKAKQSRREQKSRGQKELFSAVEIHDPTYFQELRDRYLLQASSAILETFKVRRQLSYDEVWANAMSFPLVWEIDLKSWIATWVTSGQLTIEGMKPRQRVPKRDERNVICWHGSDEKDP